ncbi:MAG: VOC family protein [Dehalococcoidia bacterium]
MTTTTNPAGTHVIAATPYLTVKDAAAAIDFYTRAFGAVETAERIIDAGGRIGHAEFMIGDVLIMISDEHPEIDVLGPLSLGGSSSALVLTVEDADAAFERAVAAGTTVVRPLKDEPYGRTGKLEDPFGHVWFINA